MGRRGGCERHEAAHHHQYERRRELEIWLNETGRDLLGGELQNLDERSDDFHLGPEEFGGEVPVQARAYREGDHIIEWAKVMFRPDAWDRRHFPHVFDSPE